LVDGVCGGGVVGPEGGAGTGAVWIAPEASADRMATAIVMKELPESLVAWGGRHDRRWNVCALLNLRRSAVL
jgi:hypothetical protein